MNIKKPTNYKSEAVLCIALNNCKDNKERLDAIDSYNESLIDSGYILAKEFCEKHAPNYTYCYNCQAYHNVKESEFSKGNCHYSLEAINLVTKGVEYAHTSVYKRKVSLLK